MTTLSVQPSYPIFVDRAGKPLKNGYVWIGAANLNAITNPIAIYWDAALTQPAVQPVRTLNGYPANNGTPGRLYVNSDFSITVQDSKGTLVYSAPSVTDRYSDVVVTGVSSSEVSFLQAGTGAQPRTAQSKLRDVVSVKDFGAVGDGIADDTIAIQAAFNAANGTGRTVVVPCAAVNVSSSLNQNNHSHYSVDWGQCRVGFTGNAGTYLLDMQQAGRISHTGGVFTGNGSNHFVRTCGSAVAQATLFPSIPNEDQWARQLTLEPSVVSGFATVFDLQNFSREIWVGGYVTQNATSVKSTGKVVNVYAQKGSIFYSSLPSSKALLCRGDAADATYRYAEGLFFNGVVMDMVGTTVDVQDVYLLDLSGAQIKTAANSIAVDITKGVCPITRELFLSRVLMQGRLRLGNGLVLQHLFGFVGTELSFSDTGNTAVVISDNCKGILINGCLFNNPTGTPRMFSVGANCADIRLQGLVPDAGTYINAPTIDPTSYAGVKAEYTVSWTPTIAFGGNSLGVTYATQAGRAYVSNGMVTGFFTVLLTDKGSSTGAATITGLPLQCLGLGGTATIGRFGSLNTALTPICEIAQNSSAISIRTGASGSDSAFTNADFSNNTLLAGSFSFPIAA
jgi:hypothetical protein